MSNSKEQDKLYTEGYTLEQRKNLYSNAADAYNRARPRYPQAIIHRVLELAKLPPDARILELGCGPGTASTAFAELGFTMVCLEPSQEAFQLANNNCSLYENVEIFNTTFEEWEIENEGFNAVLAATSFHWISPEIRYHKTAQALKEHGSLILLWNITLQPQDEVCQILQEVYQNQAVSVSPFQDRDNHEKDLIKIGQTIIDSGLFKDLISENLAYTLTYTIDDYLALLSTFSGHITLELQQRDSLFDALKRALDMGWGKSFQVNCLSSFHIARKT